MGISLNDIILYTLSLEHDQIVLAQDYKDLEYMTRKLIVEYQRCELEVNNTKQNVCSHSIQCVLGYNNKT